MGQDINKCIGGTGSRSSNPVPPKPPTSNNAETRGHGSRGSSPQPPKK